MTDNSIIEAAKAETTAEKTPVKNFLEGAGILQDTVGGVETIVSGDWAGGLADLAAGALDIGSVMKDPMGYAMSMGFSWLIEHIGPLKQVLDWLTGNQSALELTAKTWEQIGKEVQKTAEELTDSVNTNCAHWEGPAARDYRLWAQDQINVYTALSDSARGVASAVDLSKAILNAIRGFVRGLIADTLAKLVSILFRYAPPAYPIAIAAEGVPLIVSNASKATQMVRRMVDAFGRLGKLLGRLGEHLTAATKYLNRGILAADIAIRRRGVTELAQLVGKSDLLKRAGTEAVKEGIKYLGPRGANGLVASSSGSTDPNAQIDLGETREKQKQDHRNTRVVTESGGTRITGEL